MQSQQLNIFRLGVDGVEIAIHPQPCGKGLLVDLVKFDETMIYLNVNPPSHGGWQAKISWNKIIRVCFKPGDFLESDEIYIFIEKRPESYVIPIEADGGLDVWNELISRGFFDVELSIKIASANEGIYCWPMD